MTSEISQSSLKMLNQLYDDFARVSEGLEEKDIPTKLMIRVAEKGGEQTLKVEKRGFGQRLYKAFHKRFYRVGDNTQTVEKLRALHNEMQGHSKQEIVEQSGITEEKLEAFCKNLNEILSHIEDKKKENIEKGSIFDCFKKKSDLQTEKQEKLQNIDQLFRNIKLSFGSDTQSVGTGPSSGVMGPAESEQKVGEDGDDQSVVVTPTVSKDGAQALLEAIPTGGNKHLPAGDQAIDDDERLRQLQQKGHSTSRKERPLQKVVDAPVESVTLPEEDLGLVEFFDWAESEPAPKSQPIAEQAAARAPRVMQMPQGVKDHPYSSPSDIQLPSWLSVAEQKSLSGILEKWKSIEETLFSKRDDIDRIKNERQRATACRHLGLALNEISQQVKELESALVNEKTFQASMKSRQEAWTDFSPKALQSLMQDISSAEKTEKASFTIEHMLQEMQISPKEQQAFFRYQLCIKKELLPYSYKREIKPLLEECQKQFEIWSSQPEKRAGAQLQFQRLLTELQQSQKAVEVNCSLDEMFTYMQVLDEALASCPDEMKELKGSLQAMVLAFPRNCQMMLMKMQGSEGEQAYRTFEEVKSFQINSLALFLQSERGKEAKGAIYGDSIPDDMQQVATIIKRFIPDIEKFNLHQTVTETPTSVETSQVIEASQAENTIESVFNRYKPLFEKYLDVSSFDAITLKNYSFEDFEKIEKRPYLFLLETDTEFGPSNSGSLSRGAYVHIFTVLQSISKSELDVDNVDRLGRALFFQDCLLDYRNESPSDISKKAMALLKLQNFISRVKKANEISNTLTDSKSERIRECYKKLGISEDQEPSDYIFSVEQVQKMSREDIEKLKNEVVELLGEEVRWNKKLQYPVGDPDDNQVSSIKPYDTLVDELMLIN